MSEPTYGSQYDPQQGYGGQQYGGQQYGGQQYGGPPAGQSPYPTGQQPQQPQYGGYGQQPPPPQQQPGGYPSGSYPAPAPAAKSAQDRFGLAATILTIVGYVCAGAGVLSFILNLAADGDGIDRFAGALEALILGIGLGGINYAIGTWLGTKSPDPSS